MSYVKTLKVTDADAFDAYNALRIRAAGIVQRIPTTNEMVEALSNVASKHFAELTAELAGTENSE